MQDIINKIKNDFHNSTDLIIKEINITNLKKVNLLYLESITSSDKINDYILKNLSSIASSKNKFIKSIEASIPGSNLKKINKENIIFYLINGFLIIIYKNNIYALETRADITRSISTPDSEPSSIGPKDAFVENIQINLGLIKRRIKSPKLRNENFNIGKYTNTQVSLLYIDDIAEQELINNIKEKINNINIDGILDASNLGLLLTEDNKVGFPKVITTERPDLVATSLLEGKVAIIVDTSPFALVIPAFFADFINPVVDNYASGFNMRFIKLLRLFCYVLSMITPAFYISVINYNQETIPTNLLINFASQRKGVPFPGIIEAIIMLVVCEILKESDSRFPNSYGSAISILGALVLGEAAVSAGIVSPIMIIVIALTFITSLIFTDYEINASLRHFRFVFLLFSAIFGLFGLFCAMLYFLIMLNSNYTFNKPYNFPVAPFDYAYLKKTLLKDKIKKDTKRSKMLTKKNITKQAKEETS